MSTLPTTIDNLATPRPELGTPVGTDERYNPPYAAENRDVLKMPSSSSVFYPRACPSLQTHAPRLQFCPKAGLPLQTQEPRLQFY